MVKVLFAGPSLFGCAVTHPGVDRRPPAAQGDLQRAVLEGATVIGLVDGLYESIAAIWHKEILFALSEGVQVLGAASLGALRAAECEMFGMVPIGDIAASYIDGRLDDDAAVAQLHAPAELGFQPVTEALVDCPPAIEALHQAGLVNDWERTRLLAAADGLFFKDRTWTAIFQHAGIPGTTAAAALRRLKTRDTSIKRRDALQLVDAMAALLDIRCASRPSWNVARTYAWQRTFDAAKVDCPET